MNINRREFLKTAAIGAAGLTVVPNTVLGKAYGHTAPSDKLNIAGIGVGGVGRRGVGDAVPEEGESPHESDSRSCQKAG